MGIEYRELHTIHKKDEIQGLEYYSKWVCNVFIYFSVIIAEFSKNVDYSIVDVASYRQIGKWRKTANKPEIPA